MRATSMTSTGSPGQNVIRAAAAPTITAGGLHAATAWTFVAKSSASSGGTYVAGRSRTTLRTAWALVRVRC